MRPRALACARAPQEKCELGHSDGSQLPSESKETARLSDGFFSIDSGVGNSLCYCIKITIVEYKRNFSGFRDCLTGKVLFYYKVLYD